MKYEEKNDDNYNTIGSDTLSNQEYYILRLYISGKTKSSVVAISNLQKICEDNLYGRYKIEIIDLQEYPQLAKEDQILASQH